MFSGPGFGKPTHQYGQSFGDQAEVLDGGALVSEQPGGQLSPEALAAIMDAEWAGKDFSLPYEESE